MKKKGGTAAGVPRSTGEAQSVTVSNGAPRDQVCGHRISSYLLGRTLIKLSAWIGLTNRRVRL